YLANFAEFGIDSPDIHQTVKIAQLTGEIDRQTRMSTMSQTQSRFGIVGCDLGQSFEHQERVCFLFGDTTTDHNIRRDSSADLDSIGFTSDIDASKCIRVDFDRSYPRVNGIDQRGFCVPPAGISMGPTQMYVFFTTDHRGDGSFGDTMGRSVLARSSDGGLTFGSPLYDLSLDKFINMSLQLVNHDSYPGLPGPQGKGILMWGSGSYRRSNVYLAYVPADQIEDRSAFSFFAGGGPAQPLWSAKESDAVPVILSGSVGELCVRWNAVIRRFVLLYNADNPVGILERQAVLPWGPWTGPQNIFDLGCAFGQYIHIADGSDGLSDPGKEAQGSGFYGPYMIDRYTKPNSDGSSRVFFVLSVWNPYNTMLMSTTIRAR
ncbi:hypothetical protein LTR06_011508, partial [Exophiala xenobiotica]